MADSKNPVQLPEPSAAEQEFAQQLVERAKTDGMRTQGLNDIDHLRTATTTASIVPPNRQADACLAVKRRVRLPRRSTWYAERARARRAPGGRGRARCR